MSIPSIRMMYGFFIHTISFGWPHLLPPSPSSPCFIVCLILSTPCILPSSFILNTLYYPLLFFKKNLFPHHGSLLTSLCFIHTNPSIDAHIKMLGGRIHILEHEIYVFLSLRYLTGCGYNIFQSNIFPVCLIIYFFFMNDPLYLQTSFSLSILFPCYDEESSNKRGCAITFVVP